MLLQILTFLRKVLSITRPPNHVHDVVQETDEKGVIVSHYTSTLDVIESICKKRGYGYHRLDGHVFIQLTIMQIDAYQTIPYYQAARIC